MPRSGPGCGEATSGVTVAVCGGFAISAPWVFHYAEAVIDQNTAEDQGWALGDSMRVLTKAGPTDLVLVGTARYGALGGVPGSSLVATTDATAQRLFAAPGRYDSVVVAGVRDLPGGR